MAEETALQQHLAAAGRKWTRQRELVVRTFFALGEHVSAVDLHREVQRRDPRIGLVTVYRTLRLLRQAGLAEERQFRPDCALFEPTSPRHHDHMICTGCGAILEFENPEIEALQERVARRAGFQIRSHKLELYGLCRGCRRTTP